MKTYEAGTTILFTEGEYCSFGHVGIVVTLKDCDIPELLEEYKTHYKPETQYDEPRPMGFISWLITSGYASPAEVEEIHITDIYGGFSIDV